MLIPQPRGSSYNKEDSSKSPKHQKEKTQKAKIIMKSISIICRTEYNTIFDFQRYAYYYKFHRALTALYLNQDS